MTISYTRTEGAGASPDSHRLGQARIQVFEAQPEYGDRTDMYVFEFGGVCVHVRQRSSDTFVHVEDDIADDARPLVVSVNNGPEMHYGENRVIDPSLPGTLPTTSGELPSRSS
ncbi:MAG: hypothetical protein HOQ24_13585 [Mycobacteriaceae bacterium]|nr:hypothetical protein [Mycobacteriaceae bacterium]